jgi:hypothetical protein
MRTAVMPLSTMETHSTVVARVNNERNQMQHRVFVISDLQVPYHDVKAVASVAQMLADFKTDNDTVVTIGDEQDFQTISRWSMGTALEFEGSIARDRDATVQVFKDLQVEHTIRSNHTDRLYQQVMRRMPGLSGLPELELENFWRLPELGITHHRKAFELAPNWLALHGDESGMSQSAGSTAMGLARKTGMNVVCGHSHRLGLVPYTTGIYGNHMRTLFGLEAGNLMDPKKVSYAKTFNWQQGFAVLYVDGKNVMPVPIPIVNKSFVMEGTVYSW